MSPSTTHRSRQALAAVSTVVLGACAGGPAPGAGGSHMDAHYSEVQELQRAVIAGDVEATRGPARWLSTHEAPEFPPAAGPALEAMRTEARVMIQQRDILPVARTLGRIGVACGSCHTAVGAGVGFPVEEPPASSQNPATQMLRHAWAMDRIWEGLVAPSDASWNAGAGALAAMPLDFGGNDQANRLARRVRELSEQARRVSGTKERAETYGDLLETCALCHGALRMRPR